MNDDDPQAPIAESARAEAVSAIEGEMARLVRSVRRAVLHNAERFSAELQPSGYSVLQYIVKNHPTAPGAIIHAMRMDKSALSRQLRTLKEQGFVSSVPDPDDGRAQLYAPTPLTLERLERMRAETMEDYADALDGWPTPDVQEFVRLLGEFNDRTERR
ncbi:MarR family winged helix-turn-helix transcriptional regulator [Herbiconiux sp. P18]|uniref:MarR family winged helix-turn-helix transcriptional regulator n=1 Tax=Herbiconiux liangxiaofengii TaxID=3342795 RepID=UPI0035BC1080